MRKNLKLITISVFCLFLAACDTTGLNQISVKKIKNEANGEVEEYRSIKISEDEENDYFLDVRIPVGYTVEPTEYGSFVFVYKFSKGITDAFSYRNIFLTRTVGAHNLSLEDYENAIMVRGSDFQRKVILDDKADKYIESYAVLYVTPCQSHRTGSICFSGQKEVRASKLFNGKNAIWTVEYLSKINPLKFEGRSYEEDLGREIILAEKDIRNCCEIKIVKKPEKSHQQLKS